MRCQAKVKSMRLGLKEVAHKMTLNLLIWLGKICNGSIYVRHMTLAIKGIGYLCMYIYIVVGVLEIIK